MKQIWIIARNTIQALVRKKDFYVFFLMLLLLLVLLLSEKFFGIQDTSRYMKDIGFSGLWLFTLIIAVTFAARQMPEEIEAKTIFPLLAKPVSRPLLLLGRFLGSVLAASSAYTIFYLLYICLVSLRGEGVVSVVLLIQSYFLGLCFVSMVCAVSIFLSLCFTFSAAITSSFIIYLAVMWCIDNLRAIILSAGGLKSILLTILFYLVPHYEFYDLRVRLIHAWEALPAWIFFAVVGYTVLYVSMILCLSHLNLRRKVF